MFNNIAIGMENLFSEEKLNKKQIYIIIIDPKIIQNNENHL